MKQGFSKRIFMAKKTAKKIMLAIRAETFGNLYFNTWEAVDSKGSHLQTAM